MNAAMIDRSAAQPGNAGTSPSEFSPAVYAEMRRIARRHLRFGARSHTLQPTALVHEAYLKLSKAPAFAGDTHFLATASRAMRQVLVDYARGKATQKRLAHCTGAPLAEALAQAAPQSGLDLTEIIALDAALDALAEENDRVARLLEMCYFGGMTAEEAANALGMSVHMARHDLRFGQAWLRRRLQHGS